MIQHSPFSYSSTSPELIRSMVMLCICLPLKLRIVEGCCQNDLGWCGSKGARSVHLPSPIFAMSQERLAPYPDESGAEE